MSKQERITDFSEYLFRCSGVGSIMGNVKVGLTEAQEKTFVAYTARYRGEGKELTKNQLETYFDLGAKKYGRKDKLSIGAESYLKSIHKEEMLIRRSPVSTKQMDKGLQKEEEGITMYSELTGQLFLKNKQRFNNYYLTGEPDNIQGKIRDIKNSWDVNTFPMYEDKLPNTGYDWQVQGYMDLTGLQSAELIYCLCDTPEKLVNDHLRRLDWQHNVFDTYGDIRDNMIPFVVEQISNLIYTEKALKDFCDLSSNIHIEWFDKFAEIPIQLRCRVFDIERDDAKIDAIHSHVEMAREYMNSISDGAMNLFTYWAEKQK